MSVGFALVASGRLPYFVHKGKKTAIVPALVSTLGFFPTLVHICNSKHKPTFWEGKEDRLYTSSCVETHKDEEKSVTVLISCKGLYCVTVPA